MQANTVHTRGELGQSYHEGDKPAELEPPPVWKSHVTLGCFGGRLSEAAADGVSARQEGKEGREAAAAPAEGKSEQDEKARDEREAREEGKDDDATGSGGGWFDCTDGMLRNLAGPIKG